MNSQNLSLVRKAYPSNSFEAAVSAPANQQLLISSVTAINNSVAEMDLGVGYTVNENQWKCYELAAATTDVTATIQAGSVINLFPTTNNYGFIVQAKTPFEMLSFTISQAQSGAPVYSYEYWNGSAWTTLELLNSPVYVATGSNQIVFKAPIDWAVGDAGDSALDDEMYALRVRATTAPATAVQADALKVCKMFSLRESISSKGALEVVFDKRQFLLEQGCEIVGYFEMSDTKNVMEVVYQLNP